MSKDFDTTLSDAIDFAAAAAQPAGASAARLRGRKRAMRKRIAVSTMSLVLVATGTTAAFKYVGSITGGTPQVTSTNPNVTTSPQVTPSPVVTPTPSPSSSPSLATSPATTVADPHHVDPAAWLSPSQIPFDSTFHWKSVPASSLVGQPLNPTVAYVAKDTSFQALTTCGDPTQLLNRTIGAQQAGDRMSTGSPGTTAGQFIFFFADATAAQQTFAWIQSQYGPSCLSGFKGVSITKTADEGVTGAAWLTVEHPSAGSVPVDLAPYNREYFVLRGSTIAWVSIISTASSVASTHDDAAELSALAAHLCVYGAPCH